MKTYEYFTTKKPKPKRKKNLWFRIVVVVSILTGSLFLFSGCSGSVLDEVAPKTSYVNKIAINDTSYAVFGFYTNKKTPSSPTTVGAWLKDITQIKTTYTVFFSAKTIGLTSGKNIKLSATLSTKIGTLEENRADVFLNEHDVAHMMYVPENHDVVVAVLDTGIDKTHPVFEGLVDSRGWNFSYDSSKEGAANNNDVSDISETWHGTSISGLIASKKQPGVNTQGINFMGKVKILPIKWYKSGIILREPHELALKKVLELKPDIINCSYGDESIPQNIEDLYTQISDQGTFIICSAGNWGKKLPHKPHKLGLKNLIVVGGLDLKGNMSSRSDWGYNSFLAPSVQLSVPIKYSVYEQWYSRYGYYTNSGTSFAAPIIAGVLAKMKSYDNTKTNAELKALLIKHAIDIPGTTKDGYGHINYKTLAEEFVTFQTYYFKHPEDEVIFQVKVAKDKLTGNVSRAVFEYAFAKGYRYSLHEEISLN